jgi:membrane associated rhomboid family serine protease
MFLVMLVQTLTGNAFFDYGIFPRTLSGLKGIAFAPFIHSDWGHFISNAVPLLLLGFGVFYYFSDTAYRVFFWIFLATGLWVWVSARASYHVGSSGIVYGLSTFLVVSALIKRNTHLLFFSLLVIFLYGSMIWGIFPIDPKISWESHLMGALAGILLALRYRNKGVEREAPQWEDEPEEESEEEETAGEEPLAEEEPLKEEEASQVQEIKNPVKVVYHYRAGRQDAAEDS